MWSDTPSNHIGNQQTPEGIEKFTNAVLVTLEKNFGRTIGGYREISVFNTWFGLRKLGILGDRV